MVNIRRWSEESNEIRFPGWIFEATRDYNICFSVSGGFLLLAGLISCGVDVLKRRQTSKLRVN